MATNIVQMTDGAGNKQYPVTSAEAVGMPDGSGNLQNYLDKRATELNISELYPTQGIGGSNKYDLATAIAQVDSKYRGMVGLKITFIDNSTLLTQTWKNNGGSSFSNTINWERVFCENDVVDIFDVLCSEEINSSQGGLIKIDGTFNTYGGYARVTDNIDLSDTILVAYNLKTINTSYAVVAFYDENDEFIPEYNQYFLSIAAVINLRKIIISKATYPKAKTCRISYDNSLKNTVIKKYNLNSLLSKNIQDIKELYDFLKVESTNSYYTSPYLSGRYITAAGAISNWGSGKLYKILKSDLENKVYISQLTAVNGDCILIGGFKEGDVFVQSILTARANEVKDIYLDKSLMSEDVEYILLSSVQAPIIYTLNIQSLNDKIVDINSQLSKEIQSINDRLTEEITPEFFGGFINPEGVLKSYAGTKTTDFLLFENHYYNINKIRTPATKIFLISFYDDEEHIILDYNEFLVDAGGGERDVTDIRIDSTNYPLAKKIRISGKFYDDTVIKASNYQELNEKVENIEDSLKNADFSLGQNIYGIGDSIGSQILAALVKNIGSIDGHTIVNGCVGGETTLDTLAKNNVIPYIVTPFTIPATTTQSEAVNVYSSRYLRTVIAEDGETLTYVDTFKKGYDGAGEGIYNAINSWNNIECNIGGVDGTLYFIRNNPNRANNYFIRDLAGEEVVFDRPQLVIPKNLQSKQCIWIDFMGTNGGWTPLDTASDFYKSADILVNYYEQLRNYFNHENYVFLGFYMTAYLDSTTGDERIKRWKYFEEKMVEKFGKHYLSVRQYLREYGWRDAGYKLGYRLVDDAEGGEGAKKYTCLPEDIEADIQAIKDGKIPYCIVNGPSGVHMLAKPSACVANQVIKRLYELGCINSCPQIDISTIQDAENADINEPDYGS